MNNSTVLIFKDTYKEFNDFDNTSCENSYNDFNKVYFDIVKSISNALLLVGTPHIRMNLFLNNILNVELLDVLSKNIKCPCGEIICYSKYIDHISTQCHSEFLEDLDSKLIFSNFFNYIENDVLMFFQMINSRPKHEQCLCGGYYKTNTSEDININNNNYHRHYITNKHTTFRNKHLIYDFTYF
jgi:hypothetical protein